MDKGSLPVGNEVLQQQPLPPPCVSRHGSGVCSRGVFAPGKERFPATSYGETDIKLTGWLPGKLTEGQSPHHSLDKDSH